MSNTNKFLSTQKNNGERTCVTRRLETVVLYKIVIKKFTCNKDYKENIKVQNNLLFVTSWFQP